MGQVYGLPLRCPKCPEKRYYGILKGENSPTRMVRLRKTDICPNCKTQLIEAKKPVGP